MFSFLKSNLSILIIVLILFSYLGIKALNPDGWDGWGFGSAQVLMSSQHWAHDGFAKNYFLFIPYPYGKLTHYLDEPEFRNRPVETISGVLSLTRDQRLYYTHYPPLFLFPYASIAKLGIDARPVYRIFSLLISLTGLLFFYLFIKSVSNKIIATIASAYYGFSVMFLNYADSIATQPFTLFFTFLILFLSVLAGRNYENQNVLKKYSWAIWFAYLALSLLSYDATFYIFAFIILYDLLVLKKFLWKRWLIFALAPILGFGAQVVQNTWYLGWHNMISDFSGIYANRTFRGVKNFMAGLLMPFHSMASIETFFIFKKTVIALTSAAAIFGILWKFRQKINLNLNYFKIIIVLAVAAVAQPFFINATGGWPYQGVLTAAFWGLLIGAASIFINDILKKDSDILGKWYFWVLTAIILILWSVQFYSTLTYVRDWPNNRPDQKVLEFSKEIKNIYLGEEKMAFRIIPQNQIWRSQFATFSMEYYFGMPKIDFANSHDLLTDFWWLRKISEYPYYSFIVADNKAGIDNLYSEIKKTLPNSVSEIKNIQSQYFFTVGPK